MLPDEWQCDRISIQSKLVDIELFKTHKYFDHLIRACQTNDLSMPEIYLSTCQKYLIKIPSANLQSDLVSANDFSHECCVLFVKLYEYLTLIQAANLD